MSAKVTVAPNIRVRSQTGQTNGGVRVIGHRFIKKCNQPLAGCMVGFGGVDEERQSEKDQSVTTEISTRRLVDFDDLGSFGP